MSEKHRTLRDFKRKSKMDKKEEAGETKKNGTLASLKRFSHSTGLLKSKNLQMPPNLFTRKIITYSQKKKEFVDSWTSIECTPSQSDKPMENKEIADPFQLNDTSEQSEPLKSYGVPPKRYKIHPFQIPSKVFVDSWTNTECIPIAQEQQTFGEICDVELPSKYWSRIHFSKSPDAVCFAKWEACNEELGKPDVRIVVKKSLDCHKSSVICTIFKKSNELSTKPLFSKNDLQSVLHEQEMNG